MFVLPYFPLVAVVTGRVAAIVNVVTAKGAGTEMPVSFTIIAGAAGIGSSKAVTKVGLASDVVVITGIVTCTVAAVPSALGR